MQYNEAVEIKIGKEGVKPEHVKALLKKHKVIKIRFLHKEGFTTALPGVIVKKIGRTIILKEKK